MEEDLDNHKKNHEPIGKIYYHSSSLNHVSSLKIKYNLSLYKFKLYFYYYINNWLAICG